jgi:hypothetical protein
MCFAMFHAPGLILRRRSRDVLVLHTVHLLFLLTLLSSPTRVVTNVKTVNELLSDSSIERQLEDGDLGLLWRVVSISQLYAPEDKIWTSRMLQTS